MSAITLHRQCGFTLLEVLVSLIILAIGLLGLAQLHLSTLRQTQSAEFRSIASSLAGDMFDRMRANHLQTDGISSYESSMSSAAGPCNSGTPLSQALNDIACWKVRVTTLLPQGEASISCNTYSENHPVICTVTIQWQEPTGNNDQVPRFSYSGAI